MACENPLRPTTDKLGPILPRESEEAETTGCTLSDISNPEEGTSPQETGFSDNSATLPLDIMEPKTPDDVYKSHLENVRPQFGNQMHSARQNLAASFSDNSATLTDGLDFQATSVTLSDYNQCGSTATDGFDFMDTSASPSGPQPPVFPSGSNDFGEGGFINNPFRPSASATNQSISSSALRNLRSKNEEYLCVTAPGESEREKRLNVELQEALKQNRLLQERLSSMERLAERLNKENVNMRLRQRTVTRRNVALQNRCRNLEENISKVFNKDQIEAMGRESTQGMKWEAPTIRDSLVLKLKCGTAGYEEIRKKFPYPSARTLERRIQHIDFESSIIDAVFDMILYSIKNFKEEQLDCMLAGDEMAIDPSEMIDPTTKKPIGRTTLNSHSGIANKALVFILGGISSRWKQTVAYYFTKAKAEGEDADAVGRELGDIVSEIIKRAEAIGLRVHSVTTDMGPENRAMWRFFGVSCRRDSCVYAVPHPVRRGDSLCFVADVPHLFKSLKRMLISNGSIFLPDDIVSEENLPSNEVKACHIKDLLDFQGKMELKISPKLKEVSLKPKGHFQGMKVGNARGVVNRRTATGLHVLAAATQDPSYSTTAWFIDHVNRWFELMSSRSRKIALSKANMDKYDESLNHLKKTIRLFNGMKVGATGSWKPVQTGVILSTNSILHLQDYLLKTRQRP